MLTSKFIKVATPQVGEEEIAVVREVLLSGSYVSGAKVEEFEKRFAEYVGVDHAIAVNSGTAALHIALEVLGVGKGDEVIVPPLTFFATVSSVLYLGAVPIFADIDLDDLCLSPESTERFITSKTKAIIPVHLFGMAAKMDDFMTLSAKHSIPVLEDCAQAHGTEYNDNKVGSIGRAGAFSFFATKHMTTGEIASQSKIIRSHGMTGRDDHVRLGFNNRMTEIEAAMGIVQLKKLDQMNQNRISNSEYLIKQIGKLPWAHVPVPKKYIKHTYFWCPLMVDESTGKSIEGLKEHLKKNGIGFRHRYNEPLYKQPVLKRLGLDYSNIQLPNVEKVAGRIIGLPNHPMLTQNELDVIVDTLQQF
jgi:perosamine synthetase